MARDGGPEAIGGLACHCNDIVRNLLDLQTSRSMLSCRRPLLQRRVSSSMAGQPQTAIECMKEQASSCLFVCLGNICRSPAAEAVFRSVANANGLTSLKIDSCGTGGGSASWYKQGGFSYGRKVKSQTTG